MKHFYIEKSKKEKLDNAIKLWFNFYGWCNSLIDSNDAKYIHSKGIRGINFLIFLLFFYPILYISKNGFHGVPFPFNFLKKKNKQKISLHKKAVDIKTRINVVKNKIKKIKVLKRTNTAKPEDLKELEHLSEKKEKLIKNSNSIREKSVKKKKRKMSNDSYIKRQNRRKLKFLTNPGKSSRETTMKFFLFSLNVTLKTNNSTHFRKYFSVYKDFISVNIYNLENISQKTFFDLCVKYKISEEITLKYIKILEEEGFVFVKKTLGEMLAEMYPNIKPY